MRRTLSHLAAAACLALALAACQPAPDPEILVPADPPETATVEVTVVHDGRPVADADVWAFGPAGTLAGSSGTTDAAGQVALRGDAGTWHVAASGLRRPHPTDPLCSTAADGSVDVIARAGSTTEVTVEIADSGVYACA